MDIKVSRQLNNWFVSESSVMIQITDMSFQPGSVNWHRRLMSQAGGCHPHLHPCHRYLQWKGALTPPGPCPSCGRGTLDRTKAHPEYGDSGRAGGG